MARKGLDQQEDAKLIHQQELELIERIKAGDTNAFGILVVRYQTRLIQFLYRRYGNNNLVEDVAQNVFVVAYRKLHLFQGKSMFYTWLCTIAIRQMINALQAQARRVDLKLEAEFDSDESLISYADLAERSEDSVEDLVLSEEKSQKINKLIDKIPEKLLTPLLMSTEQGMSYAQIAEQLNISLDSVRSRINRARNEFKRLIKEHELE